MSKYERLHAAIQHYEAIGAWKMAAILRGLIK